MHHEHKSVEKSEARIHRAYPRPPTKFMVSQDSHDNEKEGVNNANPRPHTAVFTLGFKEELFQFVHFVVLLSIRSES